MWRRKIAWREAEEESCWRDLEIAATVRRERDELRVGMLTWTVCSCEGWISGSFLRSIKIGSRTRDSRTRLNNWGFSRP